MQSTKLNWLIKVLKLNRTMKDAFMKGVSTIYQAHTFCEDELQQRKYFLNYVFKAIFFSTMLEEWNLLLVYVLQRTWNRSAWRML